MRNCIMSQIGNANNKTPEDFSVSCNNTDVDVAITVLMKTSGNYKMWATIMLTY